MTAFDSREEFYELLQYCVHKFESYHSIVVNYNIKRIEAAQVKTIDAMEELNILEQERSAKHDLAIGSVETLNRICKALGMEQIAPDIDIDKQEARGKVFAFVSEFLRDIYASDIQYGRT